MSSGRAGGDADPLAEHGRSDRTAVARLVLKLPPRLRERAAALLRRGELAVLHGPGSGLRFPARALPPGHAHLQLLLYGLLEQPVQEALRRAVAPGAVVYDVGANVGFFALLAARLAGPEGRVLAFEPVPEVAAHAREAALRSGLDGRVEVREEAVAGTPGREALLVGREASWSHLASRGNPDGTARTVEVDVVTLDGLVAAGAPAPDVLKLDVEGSEADVLRGGAGVLRDHRPVVICELHDTAVEVCDLLEDAGYVVEGLDRPGPVRTGPGDAHLIARPAGTATPASADR